MNVRQYKFSFLCLAGLALTSSVWAAGRTPAFPGAEGYGAYSRGGRGGRVLLVTNLDDYVPGIEKRIPGSLRAACVAKGPRIVVFRVSGTIVLRGTLKINRAYITIAGQTAPGDGICLRNYGTSISTHDVIIRHMRFRPGDKKKLELDALSITNAQNVIIDHCSTGWGNDEVLSVTQNSKNVSVQWSIMSEIMHESYHKLKRHGYGSLIFAFDGGITFHHNLFAHNDVSSPSAGGYPGAPGPTLDFRNNVIYNWGKRAGSSDENRLRINYVGNYLKPGPDTKDEKFAFTIGGTATRMYTTDNVLVREGKTNNGGGWNIVRVNNKKNKLEMPVAVPTVKTQTAKEILRSVLLSSGATLPRRDAVDERVVKTVTAGKGRHINSQKDVGGWPELKSSEPPVDEDNDGMPDAWEAEHGIRSDDQYGAGDNDGDGYTNIEEYLNNTNPNEKDSI